MWCEIFRQGKNTKTCHHSGPFYRMSCHCCLGPCRSDNLFHSSVSLITKKKKWELSSTGTQTDLRPDWSSTPFLLSLEQRHIRFNMFPYIQNQGKDFAVKFIFSALVQLMQNFVAKKSFPCFFVLPVRPSTSPFETTKWKSIPSNDKLVFLCFLPLWV